MAPEDAGGGIGGGAGGQNVVHQDNAATGDGGRFGAEGKGASDVFGAFLFGEAGLGAGIEGAREDRARPRDIGGAAEGGGEAFGLVELPFGLTARVQRDGHDEVPSFGLNDGSGDLDE